MNTKIGMSFGLALLMALGVVSIMLVMGLFSPNKAHAAAPTIVSATTSPTNPGATATIKIPFTLTEAIAGNSGEIWVKFDKLYGVPDSILKTSISIASGQTTGGVSNPLIDPTIVTADYATGDYAASDQTVKIALGDTNPNSVAATVENLEINTGITNGEHTITFASSAGITLPTGSGTAAVNNIRLSQDSGASWSTAAGFVTVRELNLSAVTGARGKAVTVTAKGFSGVGEATLWLDANQDGVVDSGEFIIESGITVSGGAFEASFTTDVNYGTTVYVNAVDGTGASPTTIPSFATYGKVSLDLTSVARGSNLKISVAQWTSADTITKVTFGAATNTTTVDVAGNTTVPKTLTATSGSFYVKVPVGTPLGSQKVTVTGDTGGEAAARYTTVIITGAPVTVTPSTGVDGQEVTISGSGFGAGVAIATISVGGVSVTNLSSGGLASTNAVTTVTADNSGNLSASFLLPNDAVLRTAGDHKIIVTVGTGIDARTGEVHVTVPGRTMTLDTSESKRGSTVNVTGTGFKAKSSITISYTNSGASAVTVSTATTDALGNWSGSFVVPTTASIPSSNTVTGAAASGSSKTATHALPGASIVSDLTEQSTGQTFVLTGASFPSYVSVTTITVGGIDAKPSPSPATDTDGNFTATIMVPGLTTGTHAISVTAGSVTASGSIEVVSTIAEVAAVSTATADVFADSIAADNLVRVWKFNNADQSWTFYDPRDAFASANTLSDTATGDIVWVSVTAEESFQSGTLYPGWNLISLD